MDNVITEINSPATESFKKIADSASNVSSPMKGWIQWNTLRYVFLIVILAVLGLNIFNYLGKTTDFITDLIKPLLEQISHFFGYTLTKTIDTSAKGAKVGVDVGAGVAKDIVDLTLPQQEKEKKEISEEINKKPFKHQPPKPTNSAHIIQRGRHVSKGGACYIGEDRGFRSCIRVREGDKCMSGEVFPRMDICINPQLR